MSAQRLALDLQAARDENTKGQQIIDKLFKEVDRLNAEIDQLRTAKNQESDYRLEAEHDLQKTQDRLRLAVDAAGLALWDWPVASDEAFFSAQWGRMIDGVNREGNRTVADMVARVHPDDLATVQGFMHALATGEPQPKPLVIESRFLTSNGWLWLETHGMVIERDARGKTIRVAGVHADITRRKQQETELVRARVAAEETSRLRTRILTNISHEVRTPLNAMMGLTHLLMGSQQNPQQQRWLDLIDKSAEALLALLNDVLDLTRIDAGKLNVESERFDLHDLLHHLSGVYAEEARAKSLGWRLALDPTVPQFIRGDANRLRQVLLNLISNAIKFTPAGGRVALLADADFKVAASGSAVLNLRLQDTGIGIDPAVHASIFEEFSQAEISTTREYGGSGLGLAIAAQLARLMGGEIALDSALGQGSTFTLSLPLKQQAQESPCQQAEGAVNHLSVESTKQATSVVSQLATDRFKGLQVLAVDDHPVNQLLVQELLERLGCQVLLARDAQQALAEWRAKAVRLVLMDVQMPGMNGLDATRAIRALEASKQGPRTWVIGVTANASEADRNACLAAGMDGYVSKPIRIPALLEALDAAAHALNASSTGNAAATTPTAFEYPPAISPFTPQQVRDLLGKDLPLRLALLRQAASERSATLALQQCHLLRGSLGWVNAQRALRLVKGIVLAAKAGDWALFLKVLTLLEAACAELLGTPAAPET